MPIIWIAVHRNRSHKPAATAGRSHAHLAAELEPLVNLPLADAFHFRFMDAVHFVLVSPFLLKNPQSNRQKVSQFLVRIGLLALNVPDDPPKAGWPFYAN